MQVTTPREATTSEAARGVALRAPRYQVDWVRHFREEVERYLGPEVSILDVGPGRSPTLEVEHRPLGCHYVAMDVSAKELDHAPPGAYDGRVVRDVVDRDPGLEARFDLVISWQVLEHVTDLGMTLENLRVYLRPGGRLVALFSGGLSVFGALNRLLPARTGVWAMKHLLNRPPETVFPAHYDRCYESALSKLLRPWSSWELEPLYRGAIYFRFSPALQRAYLAYENWAADGGRANLATHYLLSAER